METAIGAFKRITNACNAFNNLQAVEHVYIHFAGIAYQAYNRLHFSFGNMNVEVLRPEPFDQIVFLRFGNSVF